MAEQSKAKPRKPRQRAPERSSVEAQGVLYIAGKKVPVPSMDDLTWGELAELEDFLGYPVGDDLAGLQGSVRASLFFYYVGKRREDPTYTLAQAEKIPLRDISNAPPDGEKPDADPQASSAGV